MANNNVVYGLLIGLAIVILLLLTNRDDSQASMEHFNIMDACTEMFHKPNILARCRARTKDGRLHYQRGIEYTYPKYLKNKRDKIDLPEDLYWKHVERLNGLGRVGKCHTVFWNDEGMAESCSFKPKPIINALHDIYWHNRFNDIKKSPEEYQAYLNSGTRLVHKAKQIRMAE